MWWFFDWGISNVLPYEEPLRPSVSGLEVFVILQLNTWVTLRIVSLQGLVLGVTTFISKSFLAIAWFKNGWVVIYLESDSAVCC